MPRYLTPDGVAARLKEARAVPHAQRMRKEPTKSERALWLALRQQRDWHFRRQVPFGPFIVDFASHRARLIIEVDGGIHEAPEVALRDAERQRWLEGRGYRVLRFSDREVIGDVRAVVLTIIAACVAVTAAPGPSPKGGGEEHWVRSIFAGLQSLPKRRRVAS